MAAMANIMDLQGQPPGLTGTSLKGTEPFGETWVWTEMHLCCQAMKAHTGISGIPDKAVVFIQH